MSVSCADSMRSVLNTNCTFKLNFRSSSKTGFWLGIFNDESNGGIYNARKQPISWENWHVPSLLPENVVDNETYVFNSTICAKADMTDDYSWRATSCDETLPYICEIVGKYFFPSDHKMASKKMRRN